MPFNVVFSIHEFPSDGLDMLTMDEKMSRSMCENVIYWSVYWLMEKMCDSIQSTRNCFEPRWTFQAFRQTLIEFNYSSLPYISKFCWTCPASPANFVYYSILYKKLVYLQNISSDSYFSDISSCLKVSSDI